MREAIVGKDDEQFLGDEESPPLSRAASEVPAKPGTGMSRKAANPAPATGTTIRTRVAPALPDSGSSPSGSARRQATGQAGIAPATRLSQARGRHLARLAFVLVLIDRNNTEEEDSIR